MGATVTSQFSALDQTFFFFFLRSNLGALTASSRIFPRTSQSSQKMCLIRAPVDLTHERSLRCLWCPPIMRDPLPAAEMTDMNVLSLFSTLNGWAFPRSDTEWLPLGPCGCLMDLEYCLSLMLALGQLLFWAVASKPPVSQSHSVSARMSHFLFTDRHGSFLSLESKGHFLQNALQDCGLVPSC